MSVPLLPYSAIPPFSRLLPYAANAIPLFCIRDDKTLVLVTLREKTSCQQTIWKLSSLSIGSLLSFKEQQSYAAHV